jgi:lysophospholipase L1-like esterase
MILVVVAASCSGTNVQPTPIDDPVVSCPADITVTQHGSQPPTVTYDTPTASKGTAPVTVSCSPASGTQFQPGTATVKCEATDSRQHKGSCSFSVVVNDIPQLLKTKFMAFGDSLTEGKTSLIRSGIVVAGKCPVTPSNPSGICFINGPSYVEQLNTKMTARYQDQKITIVAEGLGNEEAGEGKLRLAGDLDIYGPDVLLLLEGVNDLLHTTDPTKLSGAENSIIDALQTMIRAAKTRQVKVYLATLTPLSPTRQAAQAAEIPIVNSRIRALASQEGAVLVDMYAAITLDLVGADGIHLKPEGYVVMADTWLQAIQATLEASSQIQ